VKIHVRRFPIHPLHIHAARPQLLGDFLIAVIYKLSAAV